jgi:hypothetical protein
MKTKQRFFEVLICERTKHFNINLLYTNAYLKSMKRWQGNFLLFAKRFLNSFIFSSTFFFLYEYIMRWKERFHKHNCKQQTIIRTILMRNFDFRVQPLCAVKLFQLFRTKPESRNFTSHKDCENVRTRMRDNSHIKMTKIMWRIYSMQELLSHRNSRC